MKILNIDPLSITSPAELEESLLANYSRNYARLKEKYPQIAAAVDEEPADIKEFTIHEENGETFILFNAEDKENKVKLARKKDIFLTEQDKKDFCGKIVVFSDIFPGEEIVRHFQIPLPDYFAVNKFAARTPVYILEPSTGKFKMMLCLYDFQEAFCDGRFVFFVGKDALKHFKEHLSDDQALIPDILQTSDGMEEIAKIITEIALAKTKDMQTLSMELSEHYGKQDLSQWRKIFTTGNVVKIAVFVSQWSQVVKYVAQDLCTGLKELGADAHLITENDHLSMTTPLSDLRALHALKPDLQLLISHLRPEYAFLPQNIPTISYIQDALTPITSSKYVSEIGEQDIIIPGNYDLAGAALTKYGYKKENIHNVCFLATKPNIYHPMELTNGHLVKYASDLSFISNHSAAPYDKLLELKNEPFLQAIDNALVKETFFNVLDSFYKDIERFFSEGEALWAGYQYEEIFRKYLKKFFVPIGVEIGKTSRTETTFYFWGHIGSKFLRHRVLRWLKDENINFKLYGMGWRGNAEFSPYSNGIAKSGEELCKVFNATKINLHIDHSAHHFRVCDGWASGGFFLFNYTPLSEAYEKNTEIKAFLKTIHKRNTVNEICVKLEDPVCEQLARAMFYTAFHKISDDVIETEEIKQIFETQLSERYIKFQEFVSYKNMKDLYYKNKEEFIEKAKYFLGHEKERKKIIEKTHAFIQNYTYRQLCEEMLNAVSAHFSQKLKGVIP